MSRAAVGLVVENLLTDENLRTRFAVDPMATVAELFLCGLDLTGDESISCAGPTPACGF